MAKLSKFLNVFKTMKVIHIFLIFRRILEKFKHDDLQTYKKAKNLIFKKKMHDMDLLKHVDAEIKKLQKLTNELRKEEEAAKNRVEENSSQEPEAVIDLSSDEEDETVEIAVDKDKIENRIPVKFFPAEHPKWFPLKFDRTRKRASSPLDNPSATKKPYVDPRLAHQNRAPGSSNQQMRQVHGSPYQNSSDDRKHAQNKNHEIENQKLVDMRRNSVGTASSNQVAKYNNHAAAPLQNPNNVWNQPQNFPQYPAYPQQAVPYAYVYVPIAFPSPSFNQAAINNPQVPVDNPFNVPPPIISMPPPLAPPLRSSSICHERPVENRNNPNLVRPPVPPGRGRNVFVAPSYAEHKKQREQALLEKQNREREQARQMTRNKQQEKHSAVTSHNSNKQTPETGNSANDGTKQTRWEPSTNKVNNNQNIDPRKRPINAPASSSSQQIVKPQLPSTKNASSSNKTGQNMSKPSSGQNTTKIASNQSTNAPRPSTSKLPVTHQKEVPPKDKTQMSKLDETSKSSSFKNVNKTVESSTISSPASNNSFRTQTTEEIQASASKKLNFSSPLLPQQLHCQPGTSNSTPSTNSKSKEKQAPITNIKTEIKKEIINDDDDDDEDSEEDEMMQTARSEYSGSESENEEFGAPQQENLAAETIEVPGLAPAEFFPIIKEEPTDISESASISCNKLNESNANDDSMDIKIKLEPYKYDGDASTEVEDNDSENVHETASSSGSEGERSAGVLASINNLYLDYEFLADIGRNVPNGNQQTSEGQSEI